MTSARNTPTQHTHVCRSIIRDYEVTYLACLLRKFRLTRGGGFANNTFAMLAGVFLALVMWGHDMSVFFDLYRLFEIAVIWGVWWVLCV